MPHHGIDADVCIDELTEEVLFAVAPVNVEDFTEEGCSDHAHGLGHPTRISQLAHSSVEDGEAGVSSAPGFPVCLPGLGGDVRPFRFVIVRAYTSVHNVGKSEALKESEVSPEQPSSKGLGLRGESLQSRTRQCSISG